MRKIQKKKGGLWSGGSGIWSGDMKRCGNEYNITRGKRELNSFELSNDSLYTATYSLQVFMVGSSAEVALPHS